MAENDKNSEVLEEKKIPKILSDEQKRNLRQKAEREVLLVTGL